MHIKTFAITDYEAADAFIQDVELGDNGVSITENHIVVQYYETKDNYHTAFVEQMKNGLKNNLFHEEVRQLVNDAEYEYQKEKGANQKGFDELQDKKRAISDNIATFEVKLAALDKYEPF